MLSLLTGAVAGSALSAFSEGAMLGVSVFLALKGAKKVSKGRR